MKPLALVIIVVVGLGLGWLWLHQHDKNVREQAQLTLRTELLEGHKEALADSLRVWAARADSLEAAFAGRLAAARDTVANLSGRARQLARRLQRALADSGAPISAPTVGMVLDTLGAALGACERGLGLCDSVVASKDAQLVLAGREAVARQAIQDSTDALLEDALARGAPGFFKRLEYALLPTTILTTILVIVLR